MGEKRDAWLALAPDAPRDVYFEVMREAVKEYYLADPSNPYRQSGRSSGARRWEETRRCLLAAVHKSGDFMDVGCANGLLLETLCGWAAERGIELRPHGIDFVPELVALARARFPGQDDHFEVCNAFHWKPSRRYDFVRTNVEYVPRSDRLRFVRMQAAAVAPGGRVIVCRYRSADEEYVDVGRLLEEAGLRVGGRIEAPLVAAAWAEPRL